MIILYLSFINLFIFVEFIIVKYLKQNKKKCHNDEASCVGASSDARTKKSEILQLSCCDKVIHLMYLNLI